MGPRRISPARGALAATIESTPSKSVTHRALVAAALASGTSRVIRPLDAADSRVTADGLRRLGVEIEIGNGEWAVHGRGGDLPGGGTLALADSGTSFRFLLAVACLGEAPSYLDGSQRLRERPVGELGDALVGLGSTVTLTPGGGGLPATAGGGGRPTGGAVEIPSGRSSQFASALMLIAPRLAGGLEITLGPGAVSVPYIDITVEVLRDFGVMVERLAPGRWRVPEADYPGRSYAVEGDHSSASYFLAAAAVAGGRVRVDRLFPTSRQPDARLSGILRDLGCRVEHGDDWIEVENDGRLRPFDLEMSGAPDLAPTVAVLGLFADGPSTIRGIAHLRHKESDRLELVARNLRALGRPARAIDDRLEIGPREAPLRGARIETRSDHRMAMAFSVAGLVIDGVEVDDSACVAKSNPRFWEWFAELSG